MPAEPSARRVPLVASLRGLDDEGEHEHPRNVFPDRHRGRFKFARSPFDYAAGAAVAGVGFQESPPASPASFPCGFAARARSKGERTRAKFRRPPAGQSALALFLVMP